MGEFNIKTFLDCSEGLRSGYVKSLEKADDQFEKKLLGYCGHVPDFIRDIYSLCNGTSYDISDQRYFDFLPGYRLMQIDEIIGTHFDLEELSMEIVIPFLQDYASNYMVYAKKGDHEFIVSVSEDGIDIMHDSVENFLKTIVSFYTEKVYYLDEDGYLSYDFDLEGEIGRKINGDLLYWNE